MDNFPPGSQPADKLQVDLLGSPRIEWAGQPLAIPRRQVRALLFRLAAGPQPLSRSYLSYLFWADCPDSEARQNLSRLLVYLTQALPPPKLVLADEAQIHLDHTQVEVDLSVFDRHWEAWKSSQNFQALKAAIDLYHGPFLEGFYLPRSPEFNAWAQEMDKYWEQRYLKTLALLVESASACSELELAIDSANRYLEQDNLAEEIHRHLIELYALNGDRSAALRQYEWCAASLEKELGVVPAPETTAAYRSVLDHKPLAVNIPTVIPAWNILPSLNAPLVGRQDAIAELESALAAARRAHGSTILLYGEPGIGKSRLVEEFIRRPRPRTRLLTGSAVRECCAAPYQPLVDAFRPAIDNPLILDTIPAIWIAEAGRLFPELTPKLHTGRAVDPLSEDAARQRLFEALSHLLLGCTAGGCTLILCLDDLHWADPTTLDWLAYAGQRIANQRVLIVGTYRQGESQTLTGLRASLQRLSNFREIPLSGLTQGDVDQLCEMVGLSNQIGSCRAQKLCQATGGNPFFILEILRELQESTAFEELPLPTTVQAAVQARLERLRPQVRQVIEAGSVLGLTFTFDLLHQTAGRQEMEILDGLDELVARQFLVESAAGYQFYHAIICEAVYASLSYWRKRKLHERASLAMEKLGSQDWATISWHLAQTGQFGKAAGFALRAGRAARQVFAHIEARANCDQALVLLEREAAVLKDSRLIEANQRMKIEVLYERGWALRLLGEMETYTQDLACVARLAQGLGDAHALAHLRWREAYNHRWFCRYAPASAAAQEGLRLSRECGDSHLEALCQREIGMAARETGDYPLAQSALEHALALLETQAVDPIYAVHTLGNLSTLHCRQGREDQALHLARRALELCETSNLPYERRLPLGDIGAALRISGYGEAAQQALDDSLAIAREIADRTQEIFCLGHLGWLKIGSREYLAGVDLIRQALELAEQVGSLTEQSWLRACLAEGHARLSQGKLAMEHANLAREIAAAHERIPDQQRAERLIAKLREYTAET